MERKIEDKTEEAVIIAVEKALDSDSTGTSSDSTGSAGLVKDKATPFSAMAAKGNGLEVDFEGSWYTLKSLGGISVEKLKAHAIEQAGDDWVGYLVGKTAGSLRALGISLTNKTEAELVDVSGNVLRKDIRFYNTNHTFQQDYHNINQQPDVAVPPRTFSQTVQGSVYGETWKMVSGRVQLQWLLGIDEDTDAKDLTRAIFGLKTREKEEEYAMVYLFGVETSECGELKDKTLEEATFLSFPIKPRLGYATKTLYVYNFEDAEGNKQSTVTQANSFFRAEVTQIEGDIVSGYFYYPEREGDQVRAQGTWSVRMCSED